MPTRSIGDVSHLARVQIKMLQRGEPGRAGAVGLLILSGKTRRGE